MKNETDKVFFIALGACFLSAALFVPGWFKLAFGILACVSVGVDVYRYVASRKRESKEEK